MNSRSKISLYRCARQALAVALSALVVPLAQMNLYAQAPAFVPLEAVQLDQLVAPIALYPDSLVAQILTASTYPNKTSQANPGRSRIWAFRPINAPASPTAWAGIP